VEWCWLTGSFTQGLVELELDYKTHKVPIGAKPNTVSSKAELCNIMDIFTLMILFYCYLSIPDIGNISWDVELCTRVEVFLSARYRWTQSLVLHSVTIKYTNSSLVKKL